MSGPLARRRKALIKQVAIVGGTHGNELTGIYLAREYQKRPEQVNRPSFDTQVIVANPEAAKACRRYLDQDLNRQFASASLENQALTGREQQRAKVLNQLIGPKGAPVTDLVIDLHTTTSNMGPCLLMPAKGDFYNKLAAYLKRHMPQVVIFCDEDHKRNDEHHLLATLGKFGVIVEVGPVPQGSLRQDVYQQSEHMVSLILDFVEKLNSDRLPVLDAEVEAYRYVRCLTLPLDENGERLGMVHEARQDKDFVAIRDGDPLFYLFNGQTQYYSGETLYPAFINEAAYYDNNLAMSLLEKVTLKV